MNPPPTPDFLPPPVLQRTSKLAIFSLILGIMSALCSVFTGIPSIILGVMALTKIHKDPQRLTGHGLAIAGIVCSVVLGLFVGVAFLAALVVPAYTGVQEKARMMQAINNARSIGIVLKNYAGDHEGRYPDADASAPQTANDAFRLLFVSGLVDDEKLFTAPGSPYEGDNDIGEPPLFKKALEARENHWCLTKGVTDSSTGEAPLIFENALEASWPPFWNMDDAGKPVPSRGWKSGKIIVVRNDGSASGEMLMSVKGDRVPPQPGPDGRDLFTRFADQGEYLDVLR